MISEKRRQYLKDYYTKNRDKMITAAVERGKKDRVKQLANRKARIGKLYKAVGALKKACETCGESHPACLEFHHKDPSKKVICIANAIKRAWSLGKILKEIAKCKVICSNCHRKLHWEIRHGG